MTAAHLVLTPLGPGDVPTLELWFQDEELQKRLGGMLPLLSYLAYVRCEPDYFAWMAWDGETPVGAVFMQMEPDTPQSFALLVAPDRRSRGYGRRIVASLWAQSEAASALRWRVGIEPDNIASLRCLTAAGFLPESDVPDEEGFVQYVWARER